MPPRVSDSLAIHGLASEPSSAPAPLHEEIARIFDLLRDPLLRYLWTFGLEIQDSEEILQDVFLALFRHRESGNPVMNVRSWLFRVAYNLALKRRCRTRRAAESPFGADSADPAPNPEDRLARLQNRRRVHAIVGALPERDRQCLFLRAEGLRYREIAGILDMSLGAVSQSITRTLARIARAAESAGT